MPGTGWTLPAAALPPGLPLPGLFPRAGGAQRRAEPRAGAVAGAEVRVGTNRSEFGLYLKPSPEKHTKKC